MSVQSIFFPESASIFAKRLLGIIRRSYQYLDVESLLYLYKGLGRPKLQYGVTIWAAYLQKDIDAIEAV